MGMMDKFLNVMRLNADDEEDFYDEGKIICKTYLREMQNHQKKR